MMDILASLVILIVTHQLQERLEPWTYLLLYVDMPLGLSVWEENSFEVARRVLVIVYKM
jgi:hypothetical protein